MTDTLDVGPSFTITRPTAATTGDVVTVNLDTVDWPALIRAANAADTLDDYQALPYPSGLPQSARKALTLWCRHPTSSEGTLHSDGNYVNGEPATETNPGDVLSFELCGHSPIYPLVEHPDRPVDAIRSAWQQILNGETDHIPDDVLPYWPASVTVDRRAGKTWVDIDSIRAPISHTLMLTDHTPGPAPADPTEAVSTWHGRPMASIDPDDALAIVLEAIRISKSPGGKRPPGNPPSPARILASLKPRERLEAACQLCEPPHLWPQATAARAVGGIRTDSLNRKLRQRRQAR